MPATVVVSSYHGAAGGTVTDVTAVRFKKADDDAADTANRMPIPAAGSEYSYIKHLALRATTSPTALIDTLRVYGDGALPSGIQVFMRDNAYTNPVTNADAALAGFSNNYTGFIVSAPLSIAGSIANPNTGKIFTNYLQMQMAVTNAAGAGVMPAETLTFSYLES